MALSMAVAGLCPPSARADAPCAPAPQDLLRFAASDAPLGEWSEYATLSGGKRLPGMDLRVLLVEAPWEGKARRWLELWFDRSGDNALRVTASGVPEVVVLKRGRQFFAPPRAAASEAKAGSCSRPSANAAFDFVSLRTAAGLFKSCRHTREAAKGHSVELWSSDEVQPLQMVKVLYSSGLGYELVRRGTGATSAFPERFAAAPLPSLEMVRGLLPINPHAEKAPKPAVEERADAGGP